MRVPAPDEQRQLRLIRRLRAKGMSVPKIIKALVEAEETCRGGKWHETTLRRLLAQSVPLTPTAIRDSG